MKSVTIATDGACSPNPGKGGWAAVLRYADVVRELSGGYRSTTNNRMELLAVIRGLEALCEPCHVEVITDSQYVCNAINFGWAQRWRRNGWIRNKKGQRAVNSDLWQQLLQLLDGHRVTMTWIKGHQEHVDNNRCDQLAVAARTNGPLKVDAVFEGE